MELFDIIIDAFFDGLIFVAVLLIFILFVYFSLKIFYKKSNRSKNRIIIDNDENKDDIFGINELKDEKKFKEDIEEIKRNIDNGEEQIKVDFTKAMYILKNFSKYNFFSSEDNRIVFEKLKQTIDQETEIENTKIDANTVEDIPHDKNTTVKVKKLDDGTFKVMTLSGYSIMKGRVIIKSVNYEEEKRKEEAERKNRKNLVREKVEEIITSKNFEEEVIVENIPDKKKEDVLKKEDIQNKDETIDNLSKQINSLVENDIASLSEYENFEFSTNPKIQEDKEKNEDKKNLDENSKELKNDNKIENKEDELVKKDHIGADEKKESETNEKQELVINRHKKFDELKHEFQLIEEEANIIFILTSFFDDFRGDRIKKLVEWMFDPKNLFDEQGGHLFVDIDLEERTLYIDAYLFIFLLSKFYKNPETIYESLLYSDEVLNYENLTKVINKINHLVKEIYQDEFFKMTGKSKSPVKQRLITYTIIQKEYISCQMLMIKLDIENENFKNFIDEIKKEILTKYKPKIYKASIKDKKSQIKNISNKYFSHKI